MLINILERIIKNKWNNVNDEFPNLFFTISLKPTFHFTLGFKPLQFGPYYKCTRFNCALISIFRTFTYYVLSVYMYLGLFISVFIDFDINLYKLTLAGKKAIQTVHVNFVFCIVARRSFWKLVTPRPWTKVYFGPDPCCHILYPLSKLYLHMYRIIQLDLSYPIDVTQRASTMAKSNICMIHALKFLDWVYWNYFKILFNKSIGYIRQFKESVKGS